ncbi:MAG: two-component regulator propeller domain-containing protein [Balneolaceae bacterium]
MFLITGGSPELCAQSESGISNIANHYNTAHGLSQNTVHDIIKDRDGFIWLATRNGLNRFDGKSFHAYRNQPDDPSSISSSFVWVMYEDSKSNFWVGTSGGGLNLFDRHTEKFYHFKHDPENDESLSHNTITAIFEDTEGTLWIGTEGGGLNKLVKWQMNENEVSAVFEHFDDEGEAPVGNIVLDIDEDNKENLWIATYDAGIYKYEREQELFTREFEEADFHVMSVSVDSRNHIWFGTKYGGIRGYSLETNQPVTFDGIDIPASSGFVWPVHVQENGTIWIGTYGAGLFRGIFDENEGVVSIKEKMDLKDDYILSLFKDGNMIWVGTDNTGIYNIAEQSVFQLPDWTFEENVDPERLKIYSFITDSNNRQWLGTNSGVFVKNESRDRFTVLSDELSGTIQVHHIEETPPGNLLFSTNKGLYKYSDESGNIQKIDLSNGDSGNPLADRIFQTFVTEENSYWLATNAGIIQLNSEGEPVRHYEYSQETNGLSSNHISQMGIYEDDLWIVTSSAGINLLNRTDDSVTHFTTETHGTKGFLSNRTTDFLVDKNSQIWISTSDAGLLKYHTEEDRFEQFVVGNSMASNAVYDMICLKRGELLLATQDGLYSLDTETGETVRHFFHTDDGNQTAERLFRYDNDNVLVAKNYAALVAKEDLLKWETEYNPPILLTDLQVNFRDPDPSLNLREAESLKFLHDQNNLSFEFSLLDYLSPAHNRFQYQLAGLDKEWISSEERNHASYTNLQPGNYTFRVKAKGPQGIFSDHILQIPVVISAPFWPPVIKVSVLLTFFLFLYGFYRNRLLLHLKEERVRTSIARDLHDDVSSTLSSINFFAEAIEKRSLSDKEKKRFLELISKSSKEAKEKISDIIWVIHPQDDNWESLLLKCKRYASDVLDCRNIDYKFIIEGAPPVKVKLAVKKNTWLIFSELITNVARHANASYVEIKFTIDRNMIVLSVSDDGEGFDPEVIGESVGYGLSNIKSRVEILKGKFNLDTDHKKGTRWQMQFPV